MVEKSSGFYFFIESLKKLSNDIDNDSKLGPNQKKKHKSSIMNNVIDLSRAAAVKKLSI